MWAGASIVAHQIQLLPTALETHNRVPVQFLATLLWFYVLQMYLGRPRMMAHVFMFLLPI